MKIRLVVVSLLLWGGLALAHKGKSHVVDTPKAVVVPKTEDSRLKIINEAYVKQVKPIFKKSCFDCHAQGPHLPWYSKVPLVHGLMEGDMTEAKEHLDMTKDFPFSGHGSVSEDLAAIRESIKDKSMPPFRYRIMHPGSSLTEEEAKIVLTWLTEGEKILKQANP